MMAAWREEHSIRVVFQKYNFKTRSFMLLTAWPTIIGICFQRHVLVKLQFVSTATVGVADRSFRRQCSNN